ncbi:hypothetical protein RhiJN_09694 [Ceratobasidium sp. AG-Ba]|nr:hypothetical protein RhiJN_09694 [Ceratobasidium sp. AG-Ba]QRW10437.1 hypothetical protein RhiLY_09436 [Ceratobasidium sp. AG-Ba]
MPRPNTIASRMRPQSEHEKRRAGHRAQLWKVVKETSVYNAPGASSISSFEKSNHGSPGQTTLVKAKVMAFERRGSIRQTGWESSLNDFPVIAVQCGGHAVLIERVPNYSETLSDIKSAFAPLQAIENCQIRLSTVLPELSEHPVEIPPHLWRKISPHLESVTVDLFMSRGILALRTSIAAKSILVWIRPRESGEEV